MKRQSSTPLERQPKVAMNQTLSLTLLGMPEIRMGEQPLGGFATNKAQALLFYLAVTGQPHSRDTLATLLWDGMTDVQAKKNLRTILPNLRRLVGEHVRIDRQHIAFDTTSPYWLDVAVLRHDLTPGASAVTLAARQAAIALYQGEFLSGFYVQSASGFDGWVQQQREQLHTLVVDALFVLVREYMQRADYMAGLAANRRLLFLEPWSEPAHRQQMQLLAQTGDRAAALTQYDVCRAVLLDEFGVEPLAETTALYEQIRADKGSTDQPMFASHDSPADTRSNDLQTIAPISSDNRPTANGLTLDTAPSVQVAGHNLPRQAELYGRQAELTRVRKWVVEDGCRLVSIFGIGGQGKTALAATLVHSLLDDVHQLRRVPKFQHIIWHSLLNAPPLAEVMQEWFYILSNQTMTSLPTSFDQQFSQLLAYLRHQRCLLVLDNMESILQGDERSGNYRSGYEPYGQLIHQLAVGDHNSCLLLTSRERPQELPHLEEDSPAVRSLALTGLNTEAGLQVLHGRGLTATLAEQGALVQHYSGNPLALKLAGETIQEFFDGDIAAFLQVDTLLFDDIRHVLDQQFARLMPLESEIMRWLAVLRQPVSFNVLRGLLAQPPAPRLVLDAMRSLQRRSLLEKFEEGFGLQNVVLEYTTALLIEEISNELLHEGMRTPQSDEAIDRQSVNGFYPSAHFTHAHVNRHALVLAQTKEYVRGSQTRLLLQPVAKRLVDHLGKAGAVEQLKKVLACLHRRAPLTPGYAAANLLHLLLQIGADLSGYDYSQLCVWSAYLRGIDLPRVNFAKADLTNTLFTEPLGRVFTVAYSPDGRWLAAGTREGNIHLWRVADQQLVQVLYGHGHAIIDLAFVQHAGMETDIHRWLASASADRTVGLWLLTDADELNGSVQLFHGHRRTVISVGFSADRQQMMSVDKQGDVYIWGTDLSEQSLPADGTKTSQSLFHFNCQQQGFNVARFSNDGQMLAIGCNDGTVHLWRVTGVPGPILHGHTSDVSAVAFSPDDQMLASGDGDGHIFLWRLPQGELLQSWNIRPGMVSALSFSPNGKLLASSHWDHNIRLWTIGTIEGRSKNRAEPNRGAHLQHTLVGHTHQIRSLAFSPEGKTLASSGSDQSVRVWDVQTGQPLYALEGHPYALNALALSHDGTWLAAVGYDEQVHLWQGGGVYKGARHRALQGHRGKLDTVAFSPDGRTLASAGHDTVIRLWDTMSGELRQTLYGHTQDIYRIAFHPDGDLLASASGDGTLRLWHSHALNSVSAKYAAESSPLICSLESGIDMLYALAFSPNGRYLASAGVGQKILLWEMMPDAAPELVEPHIIVESAGEQEILTTTFSPDSTKLACGGTNLIHIWDLQSSDAPVVLRHHTDWVMSLAFSPNGRLLASASEDRTIALWDLETQTLLILIDGHTESVYGVTFIADGTTLISASADGTIKFWDVQSGECTNLLTVDGPYTGMNIAEVTGLTQAQTAALKALGAVAA